MQVSGKLCAVSALSWPQHLMEQALSGKLSFSVAEGKNNGEKHELILPSEVVSDYLMTTMTAQAQSCGVISLL